MALLTVRNHDIICNKVLDKRVILARYPSTYKIPCYDTWMIPKLIDSVCNLVLSGDEIIITKISIYFQVWNNIDEKFVKIVCLLQPDLL